MAPSSVETMIGQVATRNPVLSVEPAVDDVQLVVGGHDGDQGGGGEHTGEQQQQKLLGHDSTQVPSILFSNGESHFHKLV